MRYSFDMISIAGPRNVLRELAVGTTFIALFVTSLFEASSCLHSGSRRILILDITKVFTYVTVSIAHRE